MSAKKREALNARSTQYSSLSHAVDTSQGKEQEKYYTHIDRASQQELPELCTCIPLSTHDLTPGYTEHDTLFLDDEQLVLATPQLNHVLRTRLKDLFPRTTPLSVLLLHVSQLDHPALDASEEHLQRHRYHVTQNVLTQIVRNMRRATRNQDHFLLAEGVGAAALFPSVDAQGIQNIVERIYRSICLLQAETIVPPLLRVTDIVVGYGTYKQQVTPSMDTEQSIEEVLASTGRVARRLLLRPALASSLWETMPQIGSLSSPTSPSGPEDAFADEPVSTREHAQNDYQDHQASVRTSNHSSQAAHQLRNLTVKKNDEEGCNDTSVDASNSTIAAMISTIPFLRLPTALSPRMKSLIPYTIARQFQCAPVGRNHHTLTVAMANPTDSVAILRLHEITGMTIFPVSCEAEALDVLLNEKW